MSEDIKEETPENQPDNTGSPDDGGKNTPSGDDKNSHLYARTKAAEEEVKRLKQENGDLKKQVDEASKKSEIKEQDPIEIVELINSLKDFSPEELSFVKSYAKGSGKSLKDAAVSEDVKLYVEARRDKIKKDNASLDPSNKQPSPTVTAEEALANGSFKSLSYEQQERLIKEADAKYRR